MLIIGSLLSVEYSPENLRQGLIITACGFLTHFILATLAFFFCKPIRNLDERKITEFACVFGNCGFVGFPILKALFGNLGLFWGAFFIVSFHLSLWTWGISIYARKRPDIKLTPKKVLVNYGTIPCLIGVALYVSQAIPGMTIPLFMRDFLTYLSNLCTPITMLITGALLATRTPKQIFGNKNIYYLCVLKMLLFPMVVLLITHLLGFSNEIVMLLTVMAAMPSAAMVSMLSELYDVNPGYASQAVGTTTLLCTLTLPLVLYVMGLVLGV
jgi:predicted permease